MGIYIYLLKPEDLPLTVYVISLLTVADSKLNMVSLAKSAHVQPPILI